jgi:hypothetical protein
VSPDDVRATVMALVHYVDARKWKELQELLDRNRNYEKRRNDNGEK